MKTEYKIYILYLMGMTLTFLFAINNNFVLNIIFYILIFITSYLFAYNVEKLKRDK